MSHTLQDDIAMLFKCMFLNIGDSKQIRNLEITLANRIGQSHCIVFPYARTAIYYTLKSAGLKPGDRILMPSITIKAILDVVLDLELNPVFIDSDLDTACFSIDSLKEKIKEFKPKACLLTYLFGIMPEIENIISELKSKNILIIEDFSQAFNASYNGKQAGSFGDVSIYSASAVKTFDTYGGGFAFTSDQKLGRILRNYQSTLAPPTRRALIGKVINSLIKNLVTNKFVFSFGIFHILKMLNRKKIVKFDRFVGIRTTSPIDRLPAEWFNSFTSAQANMGLKLLKRVNSNDLLRINYAQDLISKVTNVRIISGSKSSKSIFWQLIALPNEPQKFREFLYLNGIDSAHTSLIEISQLPKYGIKSITPNADYLHKHAVYLPCYSSLNLGERSHIIDTLNAYKLS
jgi:perosamine synthetase